MELKCTLETKTSKRGKQYQCLVIKLTDDYEKTVFLDQAELALLRTTQTVKPNDLPFIN